MNKHINLLIESVNSLRNDSNPFINSFLKEKKAKKHELLFVLDTFGEAIKSESKKTDDPLTNKACEHFFIGMGFLKEWLKHKDDIDIPEQFQLFNPFSNKWSQSKRYEDSKHINFLNNVLDNIEK